MLVDLVAYIRDDPLTQGRYGVVPAVRRHGEQRDNSEQREEVLIENRTVGAESEIDDAAKCLTDRKDGPGGDYERDQRRNDAKPIGPKESGNVPEDVDAVAFRPVFDERFSTHATILKILDS